MDLPINRFKRALAEGEAQIGLWCSLANHVSTEVVANAGFDWLLLDTEHSPADLTTVHQQLQAVAAGSAMPIVRPPWNDTVVIKRLLDVGVQSLLIPFVQTAAEAQAAVAATRYPPDGVRGFASTTRATKFGRVPDYYARAAEEICVLVQVESRKALENLDEIAAVEGVDGVFIGPGDLSADLGHLANPGHPEVQAEIAGAVERIRTAGKAPGILTPIEAEARRWLEAGCLFVAVGADVGILARQSDALAARFKS
ncbi:aldolase/citrate lyase family protein [Algihabitans albus]|uniref:aldolase/citrate lyase family protein n=1 Tax=Algihabitans albus TaxID=2164067 RepID=UPI000E5D96A0|nr:aldolase/citrate lyase family protein [Algihabitans albus]